MRDVLVVTAVGAFFAFTAVFVAACERIIGLGAEDRGR